MIIDLNSLYEPDASWPPMKLRGSTVFSPVCPEGFHVTITHALDVNPSFVHGPPQLVTSGGQDWIPVQTCSLEDLTVQVQPYRCWHLVAGYIQWASGRYTSYCNAGMLMWANFDLLAHTNKERSHITKFSLIFCTQIKGGKMVLDAWNDK